MEKQELVTKINQVLADEFEVAQDAIAPEAVVKTTLNLDSLSLVDMVSIIESEFGVKIKAADLASIKTFEQLYDFIFDNMRHFENLG